MMATRIGVGLALTAVLSSPIPAAGQVPTPQVEGQQADRQQTDGATASPNEPVPVSIIPIRDWTPSFPQIFDGLGRDFQRLASDNAFVIIGVGSAAAAGVHAWDGRVARSAQAGGWGSGMDEAFGPGKTAGGMIAQSSAAFGTYFIGRATHSPRMATLGAELVRAQIVAQTVTQTIKIGTRRTRPDGTPLSFPSGHTSSSFAAATVVQREFGWKAGVPAYLGAAWVAASRVQAERHFLSDVVAGATVGILAGRAVTFGNGGTRFSFAPAPMPGGVALNFVRVKK
jgi:hypothetical protein